jgi:SRSO17 transposase
MDPGRDPVLEELLASVRPRFDRAEPRRHAERYVRGLLSDLARKNGWTLAAYAGASDPTGMQRLLNAARWDTDGVRDDLRRWVAECFGDWPHGVLAVDDVRFPKIGASSVGVHRQYAHGSLRAGNAQVAVFLAYVSPRGRALVDRELYLPREWLADRARARRGGVPDDVAFADRDELAIRMIDRAFDAHGPTAWVVAGGGVADSVRLRIWLEGRAQAYMLPAAGAALVATRDGTRVEADRVAGALPASAWTRVDPDERWALVTLGGGRGERGLLIRRSGARWAGPVFYRCHFPASTDLAELVRVARTTDAVRNCVRWANENIGLDHYQVRRYAAWYRHVTLCLVAGAYLAARPDR